MSQRPLHHPQQSRHHDTTSGLSWHETILTTSPRPISSQIHDFTHQSIGTPPPLYSKKGVDALETMAMRCLLNHLDMLEVQSLEAVPEIMTKRVWREVEEHNLASLHLWQTFTKSSPSSPPTQIHKTTTQHHIPFSLLLPSISASPFQYLTSLTLVSVIADRTSSIHSLSSLPNLVSLHLIGCSESTKQTSMITDDTIRLWNKQARHNAAFPCLQSLFLRFQPAVTELTFTELDGLKQLALVVISRCNVAINPARKIAKGKGWKRTTESFHAYLEEKLRDTSTGRNYLDLVDAYIISNLTSASPSATSMSTIGLSLIQVGRQSPSASTNILFSADEIQCWVKDVEKNKAIEAERKQREQETGEVEQGDGKKRRRIKEARKRDLLQLLEGM